MRFKTVDKKILAGVVFCSVILLSVAFISFSNGEKLKATNQWVNHTHEVLYEFEQVLVYCINAETGERGYVITGNDKFLEPYRNASSKMYEHLSKVESLTKDNPAQQKNIQHIREQVVRLTAALSANIDIRRTAGFEQARQMAIADQSKDALDKIRFAIQNAKDIEDTLLGERKQASEADARQFNLIFIVLIAIIVVVLIGVYVIIISNLKALRQAQTEAMNKNLILEGTSGLIKEMQGNRSVTELAQTIISYLAAYTNAQIGALYISNGHQLSLFSGYGINKRNETNAVIGLGEGLAGQAAVEKATIFCTDIPAGHFTINTSFGTAVPENIIAFPFIFEEKVAGVIELGSLYHFTALHRQFLSMIADSIAVAIASSQARAKTQELLEETQRQAEELEAQQEELKQTNEELQANTTLLEKSEMELIAQQEELQQSNEALEAKANLLEAQKDMLKEAKVEVESKAKELELTGRYKTEFLANMSHELRTPLNSILILSQLLAQNKGGSLGEKEEKYAHSIYNSGTDLLTLINEVLDLSKVEAGKMELEIEEVRVKELVNDIHNMFNEIARNKFVDFEIIHNEPAFEHPLQTDKQRLEQILRNFLSNAFKFTPQGGQVTLNIQRTSDNQIAFSVSDTGIGIPENKQAIIFEAFQQADGSTKRKYGGTGLGLSISTKLAQALGGKIILHSAEGKGSTFTLLLPLAFDAGNKVAVDRKVEQKETLQKVQFHRERSPEPGPIAIDDRHTIKEHDKVALIIEHDERFARTLLEVARRKNYKGVIAFQGNTGLSYARHYKPGITFLEMNLPDMDGPEVLKKLKNDPGLRHIPVLIFSEYDLGREVLMMGAFNFIRKPVTETALEASFDQLEEFIQKKLKKLLIVEDNREQNNAIKELIGNGDVKSFSAYEGNEAYELMQKEKFDCVIIDLGLPDLSGIELMEKIKANKSLEKIPIVVYTGKDLSKEEITRLNKLADTVVLKTANSIERLLDETVLFLHRNESELPQEKQQMIRKLHRSDEVLKGKTVLLVDDDMRNIYSLVNALEDEGLNCLNADNGKEALSKLEEVMAVDIVLMDLMMPEMDGFEAIEQIRKSERYAKLPVIALTAKAMKGDREKCLEAGFSDYIAKPVNINQLISMMRVWVS